MFWLRNKKIRFSLRTLNLSPDVYSLGTNRNCLVEARGRSMAHPPIDQYGKHKGDQSCYNVRNYFYQQLLYFIHLFNHIRKYFVLMAILPTKEREDTGQPRLMQV